MADATESGLYVETDFLLALMKEDDWLRERAQAGYDTRGDDLWTTRDTLVELMMVPYREGWNVERVVADANALLDVTGDTESVLAAASHVQNTASRPSTPSTWCTRRGRQSCRATRRTTGSPSGSRPSPRSDESAPDTRVGSSEGPDSDVRSRVIQTTTSSGDNDPLKPGGSPYQR